MIFKECERRKRPNSEHKKREWKEEGIDIKINSLDDEVE